MLQRTIRFIPVLAIVLLSSRVSADDLRQSVQWVGHKSVKATGKQDQKTDAIRRLPLKRLTQKAQQKIRKIVGSPTVFRRLPSRTVDCDAQMFLFLVRNPEVLIGIWDVMEITQVKTERIAPFQLKANDHAGTVCMLDLVYGDPSVHVYTAKGTYSGRLAALPLSGQGVFALHSQFKQLPSGRVRITGTLDCFLQFNGLGTDLIARTLSGLITRTADTNFRETANFIGQISEASQRNPEGIQRLAMRLPQVPRQVQADFAKNAFDASERFHQFHATETQQKLKVYPSAFLPK